MVTREACDAWRFEQPPLTVVLDADGLMDQQWRRFVAADERGRRTVFVQEAPKPWIYVENSEGLKLPTPDDLAAASAVLAARNITRPRSTFMSLGGTGNLPQPLEAPSTQTRFCTPDGLEQRLARLNRGYLQELGEQLRSAFGVVPFVGAGMSAAFGFPLWDKFLRDAAEEFGLEDAVGQYLRDADYEGAAELLDRHDAKRFTDQIRHAFGRPVDRAELRRGAISYLPLLAAGPVITTNFDEVVEETFAEAGRTLKIIDGPREDPIVRAFHSNEDALLKIHGTYDDRTFRVFTKDEYKRGYEDGEVTLEALAWLTFTNRPLLFLGCSLEADRTVGALAGIHRRLPGLRHYAILAAHYSVERQIERQKQLSGWGVSPIWYPPGKHERIAEILREVVEYSATTILSKPSSPTRHRAPPRDAGRLAAVELPPGERHRETAAVAEAFRQGDVVFFLGAWAHLGKLPLGDTFYDQLAEHFDVPMLAGDRSAVGAFVASRRGPQVLWNEVRKRLSSPSEPSAVYRVLTALPSFLRSRRPTKPVWFFTTNYDAVLERMLTEAAEPFHLLYYMETEGLFAHTAPDGSTRVIERPEAIRELEPPATVVVKLNGGIVHGPGPPESVVIASGQFERLAGLLPDALPACACEILRERSLLFLGHGLKEADVDRLVEKFAAGERGGSWAVQLPPHDPHWRETWQERAKHLEGIGLTIIECDLEAFVAGLRAELLAV